MTQEIQLNEPLPRPADDEEISLIDLLAVMFHYRWMILGITAAAAIFMAAYSVISITLPPEKSYMPNTYESTGIVFINENEFSTGNPNTKTNASLVQTLASSNMLYDAVGAEFNLVEKYHLEDRPVTGVREAVAKKLSVEYQRPRNANEKSSNDKSLTVSWTDTDPAFAQSVVAFTLTWIGTYLDDYRTGQIAEAEKANNRSVASVTAKLQELQAQMEMYGEDDDSPEALQAAVDLATQKQLYMQAKSRQETFRAQIEDLQPVVVEFQPPEVPDKKTGPSRGKLCIIVVAAAFFMSVFIAFASNAVANVMDDPEAMSKFRDVKKSR